MLWIFKSAAEKNKNNKNYQFWQQENHPEELFSYKFIKQKLDYIHNNRCSKSSASDDLELSMKVLVCD